MSDEVVWTNPPELEQRFKALEEKIDAIIEFGKYSWLCSREWREKYNLHNDEMVNLPRFVELKLKGERKV